MTHNKYSYATLKAELDSVLAWFEQDDINLDEAVEKYKKGAELLTQLEAQLKEAENTIKKVKHASIQKS